MIRALKSGAQTGIKKHHKTRSEYYTKATTLLITVQRIIKYLLSFLVRQYRYRGATQKARGIHRQTSLLLHLSRPYFPYQTRSQQPCRT